MLYWQLPLEGPRVVQGCTPQLCGRCTLDGVSGYIDTPEHRYYTCVANKKIQDDKGYLKRTAKANT